ncbi:MAG: transcription termination factor NusA [Endomicrobium sp.]|uniref:transcription termination factor NusA n=1 Tax=Candidatus Endomicrobiellum cubanum TaxID=3242325 RepID=UPI002831071C|nr:transcription termination factor NusA [Endomicrobium sp.]MDR2395675.1 transcription termination factor NusA [Endomicrobium sp.]
MSEKSELLMVLEQIEKDKKIKKEDILAVIENALVSAYKKHVGKNVNVEASVDPQAGKMTANVIKVVVKDVQNPLLEISLQDAKKLIGTSEVDCEVKIPLDTQDFSRIAAQTAKQVIVQKIRESEKDFLFDEMKKKIGQIINGVVYRTLNKNLIVDLGKTEAILPSSEQVFKEKFNVGQHIKAIVLKVDKNIKGSGIVLSRASAELVRRLFELEVPEIYEKVVEIVNIVREPGTRTKIAVISYNPKVDPVGACVGVKGARVKPIIDELRGERIDLVLFSNDPIKYISASLSPAKVISVTIISNDNKQAEVIVSDDMLSLAIGKNGHNVRLAAKLTGWHIDVKSESQRKQESQTKVESKIQTLEKLEGLSEKVIEVLVNAGFTDIEKLASFSVDDLTTLPGIGQKTAEKIIEAAKRTL